MTPSAFALDSSIWSLPLWLILLIVMSALMLGHEVGVRLGRRAHRAVAETDNDEGVQAYLTACLSLLVLLLAFSFSGVRP